MNRFNYILIVLISLVLILTGCDKSKPYIEPGEEWKYDLSLPVPIQFGNLTMTKGDPIADLNGLELGIFSLEHGASNDIVWRSGSDNTLLYNITGVADEDGIITLPQRYFYPMSNNRNFSFYGCYPKRTPRSENGALVVEMPIWSNVDILWAEAHAEPIQDLENADISYPGYNGRYIRKGGEHPTLTFKHVTTSLIFNAVAAEGVNFDEKFPDFTITGISIDSLTRDVNGEKKGEFIPRYADLYLAVENGEVSDNGHKAGDLVPVPNSTPYVKISGLNVHPTTQDKVDLMGQFFLVPIDGNDYGKDCINVTITTNYGNLKTQIPISANYFPDKCDLKAGHYYAFNVVFYTPEEIVIKADVEEWKNGFNDEQEGPGIVDEG